MYPCGLFRRKSSRKLWTVRGTMLECRCSVRFPSLVVDDLDDLVLGEVVPIVRYALVVMV